MNNVIMLSPKEKVVLDILEESITYPAGFTPEVNTSYAALRTAIKEAIMVLNEDPEKVEAYWDAQRKGE